jgi:aryl-alcohol dehydrogenase
VVCALGCGFQSGAGSIYNVIKPQERNTRYLAVFGIGGVGSAAIMAARHIAGKNSGILGAIIAVDVNDERLELAREIGATHVINSSKMDLKKSVLEITNNAGLDAAVDCTGVVPVINSMVALVGAGGISVSVGAPAPGSKTSLDVFDMLIQCKTYVGCHQGNSYAKEVSSIFPPTSCSSAESAVSSSSLFWRQNTLGEICPCRNYRKPIWWTI